MDTNSTNTPEVGRHSAKPEKQEISNAYDWLQSLVTALLFCVIVFSFLFRIVGVVGDSMLPTYRDGDRVVVSNLFYTPKQGDTVIIRKQEFQEEPIIKRIIATEGQTVEIDFDAGIVYVDDLPLDEPYTAEPTYKSIDFIGKITVPENSVFVLGDNRNHSTDSRNSTIGCVDERYLIGRVLFRILPISDFGLVE